MAGVSVVPHWYDAEPLGYTLLTVPRGTFTAVPKGMSVVPSDSCRFKELVPVTELYAAIDTVTPVTTASEGIESVPRAATTGSCVCPALMVMLAAVAPVAVMLPGLLQTAAPPIGKLPAWVGTCGATTVAPDSTVA